MFKFYFILKLLISPPLKNKLPKLENFGSLAFWHVALLWSVCGQIHDFAPPSHDGFAFIEYRTNLTYCKAIYKTVKPMKGYAVIKSPIQNI